MEEAEAQYETSKPPEEHFSFPPYRRRHLKSETYRTLVQILSHCNGFSELSPESESVSRELRPDDSSNLRQATKEDDSSNSKALESRQPEDSATQKDPLIDGSFGVATVQKSDSKDTRKMMDEIERMMMTEQSEETIVDDTTEGIGNRDNWFVREKMLRDKLENIMKEDGVRLHDYNINLLSDSVEQNQSASDKITPMKIQEEFVDRQQILSEESGDICPRVSETLLPLDEIMNGETSSQIEGSNDHRFSIKGNGLDKCHHRQPKELEVEIISCTGGAEQSHVPMTEVGKVDEGEQYKEKIFEAFVSSLDEDMAGRMLEHSENFKDNAYSLKNALSLVEDEMQQKDMDMQKVLCSTEAIIPPCNAILDGEVEEGEIFGDYQMEERSAGLLSEDAILWPEKVDDMEHSEEIIGNGTLLPAGVDKKEVGATSFISEAVENPTHGRKSIQSEVACGHEIVVQGKTIENETRNKNDFMLEEGRNKQKYGEAKEGLGSGKAYINNLALVGQVMKENISGNCGIISKEKDNEICTKKKRGPPSEERKAKKKQKERKRRAVKNRQLGVKRLKLPPVTKPKPVAYCRHYLQGRCHEGDKCKFSHDTVPLTKSTPCCYFSRNSCMKGDDCPFDHQLSNYPCTAFASRGSCSKGDACMFSHKVQLKDSCTPTASLKPEMKLTSSPGSSKSPKKLNHGITSKQNADTKSNPIGIYSGKNTNQSEKKTLLETSALAPVGVNFLSFGKSPLVYANNVNPSVSSPQKNGSVNVSNDVDQIGQERVENADKVVKRSPPEKAPKGLRFLSFSKYPVDDSSSKKPPSLPLSCDKIDKLSQSQNYSLDSEAGPTLMKDSDLTGSYWTTNEITNKSQTASAPKGINLFSFGKDSMDNSITKKPISPPSNLDSQDIKSSASNLQNSSKSPLDRPATFFSLDQSSGSLASGIYKGTPNSTQKALFSTFAFAAKYESLVKRSIDNSFKA